MRKFVKRVAKQFHYGEKGFTLIELLVVVAILGVLAAVAVPNVGKFIGQGKSESYETELHNIQTATMAMLVDDADGVMVAITTDDMDLVVAEAPDSVALTLSEYLTGLDSADNTTASGCTYSFATDGTVTQTDTP